MKRQVTCATGCHDRRAEGLAGQSRLKTSQHCLTQALRLHHALPSILRPVMGVAIKVESAK